MAQVYAVFEGGGVRGTALVGALNAAHERGITFRAVAGASAGAIVASLVAAGYELPQIRELMNKTSFRQFQDSNSRVPGFQQVLAWRKLGFCRGEAFRRWIGELLSQQITGRRQAAPRFRDLRLPLTVVATGVVNREPIVFSERRTPDFVVADAVRMSMSIPFFFEPVRYGNELVVDGGVVSNFPIWAFQDRLGEEQRPILGFRLQPEDLPRRVPSNPVALAWELFWTSRAVSQDLQVSHGPRALTLDLPTLGVKTTDFGIAADKRQALYEAGYRAASSILDLARLDLL